MEGALYMMMNCDMHFSCLLFEFFFQHGWWHRRRRSRVGWGMVLNFSCSWLTARSPCLRRPCISVHLTQLEVFMYVIWFRYKNVMLKWIRLLVRTSNYILAWTSGANSIVMHPLSDLFFTLFIICAINSLHTHGTAQIRKNKAQNC
jgi:hypothetical protein